MKKYIKLLRPQHYIKNILMVLPVFFAGRILEPQMIFKLLIGFIGFSCIASVVYIINDIQDVEKDKLHEIKKKRPIASGAVSIRSAICIASVLFLIAEASLFTLTHNLLVPSNLILLGYLIMNILYSRWLKNVPIVDVMILAAGFVLRVLFGASLTGIEVSQWLYLTIMMFSIYMGMGKRRNESRKNKDRNTREVLHFYSEDFLTKGMQMCETLGVVFYSYWSAIVLDSNSYMIWTIPLVITILLKYELDIESENSYGDPVDVLLSDRIIILLILIYGVLLFGLLYFF